MPSQKKANLLVVLYYLELGNFRKVVSPKWRGEKKAFVINYKEQKFQSIKMKTPNEWINEETRNTVQRPNEGRYTKGSSVRVNTYK